MTDDDRYAECEICGQSYSGERAIRDYTTETWIGKNETEECVRHCKDCDVETITKEK